MELLQAALHKSMSSNDNLAVEKLHFSELLASEYEQERFKKPVEPSAAEITRKLVDINIIRDRFLSDANKILKGGVQQHFYVFHLAVLINLSDSELQSPAGSSWEDINVFLEDCYPFIRHRKYFACQ